MVAYPPGLGQWVAKKRRYINPPCSSAPSSALCTTRTRCPLRSTTTLTHATSRESNATVSSGPPAPTAPIKLIVTDVDGTLLNSRQQLDETVVAAVRKARDAGIPLMIATGKAVGPWTREILPQLESPLPEIFLQGLFIRDQRGKTLYSNTLDAAILRTCIALARKLKVALVLYGSDRIICDVRNHHTDRLIFYGEPTPEAVGDLAAYLDSSDVDIHKAIFMADDSSIQDVVRPVVDMELATYNVALTSAIEGMVEVLPPGASKGKGVQFVLEHVLKVDPTEVMALGDGENDVEMLELVGWGVAVSNAGDKAKLAADTVLDASNDQAAVAVAINRWCKIEN